MPIVIVSTLTFSGVFFLAPQLSSCVWESEKGHTLRHKNDTTQSSTPFIHFAVLILHAVCYGNNILKF